MTFWGGGAWLLLAEHWTQADLYPTVFAGLGATSPFLRSNAGGKDR